MSGSPDKRKKINVFRVWVVPFALLAAAAAALFAVSYGIDIQNAREPGHAASLFLRPNPESVLVTLSNAAEVVAAILGIAITVVAIVVELAANRYTHRITELFIQEPINFLVPGFFVVTALQALWVARVFDFDPQQSAGFIPHAGVAVAMTMLAVCLLILLPYFAFVFAFLNPIHVVDRIRSHSIRAIREHLKSAQKRQREAIRGIEQIADVGLNAMDHKDKGVSMASIDALYQMIAEYQTFRSRLPPSWFAVEPEIASNPDFVSMSPDVLADVTSRRVWFEMKILRQFQTLYQEALNRSRDLNCLIAMHTRRIAETALRDGHDHIFDLSLTFFNTYLRATINQKDTRTAYNALNQYRLLAEAAAEQRKWDRVVQIARYFKYYGLTAHGAKVGFILETVAYDSRQADRARVQPERRPPRPAAQNIPRGRQRRGR